MINKIDNTHTKNAYSKGQLTMNFHLIVDIKLYILTLLRNFVFAFHLFY